MFGNDYIHPWSNGCAQKTLPILPNAQHSVAMLIPSETHPVLFNLTDSITVDGTHTAPWTKMNWAERGEGAGGGGEQKKEKGLGGREPLNLKGGGGRRQYK